MSIPPVTMPQTEQTTPIYHPAKTNREAPAPKKVPHMHEKHGDKREDHFFWMKNKEDPDFRAYIEACNTHAQREMEPLQPLAKQLYREFVSRIPQDYKSVPFEMGSYAYYYRMAEGKDHPIYCRTPQGGGDEEVIMDGNEEALRHPYFNPICMEPSRDGKFVAFTLDLDGSQFGKIVVRDMSTGSFIKSEEIPQSDGNILWSPASNGFYYTQVNDELNADKVKFHSMGTSPDQDRLIRFEPDGTFSLSIGSDKEMRYLIIDCCSKDTSETRYGPLNDPAGAFTLIRPREEGFRYHFAPCGNHHFFLVSQNKNNWFLVQSDAGNFSPGNWTEIIAENPDVDLLAVEEFKNRLALLKREKGLLKIEVRSLDGSQVEQVPLPQELCDVEFEHNNKFESDVLRFSFTSPVTPETVFHYHMSEKKLELIQQKTAGDFNPELYAMERIWAQASDGTSVPISLFYKKGLKQDGNAPLKLYGYGSYGITYDPYFSPVQASFLERGVVVAVAHIRGGGDLGQSWYKEGSMEHKMNTFTDFISCAEHLIKEKYTRSEKLAIHGGSAGGLLMGAVINMRPDLFKVCLAEVPFVDVVTTMFDESLPLTQEEWKEWGNPNEPEAYQRMKSYSPYDNVKARAYPTLMVTSGWNDQQVQVHEPAKWVSRLREAKTDSNPLLFKTVMEGGHHGKSGRYAAYEEAAPVYAFLLHHLGF